MVVPTICLCRKAFNEIVGKFNEIGFRTALATLRTLNVILEKVDRSQDIYCTNFADKIREQAYEVAEAESTTMIDIHHFEALVMMLKSDGLCSFYGNTSGRIVKNGMRKLSEKKNELQNA